MFSTQELALMDLLDCGSADLCMLDEVYSTLTESFSSPSDFMQCGNLDSILNSLYSSVTQAVINYANTLLNQYSEASEDELEDTVLVRELSDFFYIPDSDNFKPLTENEVESLREHIESIEDTPFINCLDSHFQNVLDQTVDWDETLEENTVSVLKHFLEEIREGE